MEDRQLTPHVTLYDLTRTDHADLQAENRVVTEEEMAKLTLVAELMEVIISVIGAADIHSGRRGPKLNARVGGSENSQHLKNEAVDFSPRGPDSQETIDAAFAKLVEAAKKKVFAFGQLIVESAASPRGGRSVWIHASLGAPYRDAAKCGQILRMKDGKFETVATIS